MATVNWSLQHKRDTAANWTSNNPTLLAGQLGIETDGLTTTPKFKIGDGTSTWTALPYFYGGSASAQDLNNVLSVGNTTSGNNIVMSGTDVISDSTGTNMFVDLNASTIYSTDGYNRMAFTADISGKTSEISVRDYSVITLEKGYVSAGLTDIYSGVISQSTGWYNQIHTNLSHIEVQSNWANFRGIEYLNDWSANYSLRSLVDKGYVINNFVPYTGATSDVDLGAYLLSTKSIRVTGTSGNGDIHLRHQSADATATGQSTSLFADVNGDLKWKNDGNYYTTLKTSTNTANRIYTYPDANGTIALTSNIGTWGALNYPTWVSGTPFVKMTAAGTFALDTNTYQPLDSDLTSWAGVTRASGFDTFVATPSSANLSSLLTDKTGTGVNVFGTSPTFTTDITTPKINGVSGNLLLTNAVQTSGAITNFTFTNSANTGQTASTEISNFKVNGASKTWAAGAITTQRWNYFTANTAAFASASTITNSYGLYVEAATAGSNATITNNWAAGFSGNVEISGTSNALRITDNTSAATGVGGGITFFGAFSGASVTTAAAIKAYKDNATGGDFGFGIQLGTRINGGSLGYPFTIDSVGQLTLSTTSHASNAVTNLVSATFTTNPVTTSTVSGTISGFNAQSFLSSNITAGTTTELRAGNFAITNNKVGHTVTSALGFRIVTPTNAGTFTNTYGIYIESQTAGTQTNAPYGIFQAGTGDLNYFGGKIMLAAGTTSKAQINFASSTAPTSPNNGDLWFDGTDLKIRVSGVTYTLTKV